MSIWSSCGGIEKCWEGDYASERVDAAWIDIADSSYEPGQKMRLLVDEGRLASSLDRRPVPEACVALDRAQVQQLVNDMQRWLSLAETGRAVWQLDK